MASSQIIRWNISWYACIAYNTKAPNSFTNYDYENSQFSWDGRFLHCLISLLYVVSVRLNFEACGNRNFVYNLV